MSHPRLLLAVVLLVVAGCASPPPTSLGPVPTAVGPALAVVPLPLRYQASADRPRVRGAIEPFFPPYRPRLDAPQVTREFTTLLRERGAYERVGLLAGLPVDASRADRRRAAREAGAKWLLEASIEDAYVGLKEKPNGMHAFKIVVLVVSSILIFPAVDPLNWFLPGEDYELAYTIRYRLSEVAGGREVAGGYLELGAYDSFAAFPPATTRSWFLLGFLRAPGCFDEEDWVEIGDKLSARARHELIVGLVRALEAPLR